MLQLNFVRIVLKNLIFYRRQNLAIVCGIIISTAVLTGALVIGDSVKHSLINITQNRLGKTCFALQIREQFFRFKLANDLVNVAQTCAVAVLQQSGSVVNTQTNNKLNQVQVIGIDENFSSFWNVEPIILKDDEVSISTNIAQYLNLKIGDDIILKIPKSTLAPQNAPFVAEKETVVSLRLKIKSIVDENSFGRFSLKANQTSPNNIFVSYKFLSQKLELSGYANIILVTQNKTNSINEKILNQALNKVWKTDDIGLKFNRLDSNNHFEIISERIFISENEAKAIKSTLPEAKPVLSYLVNEFKIKDKTTPYSFVAATENNLKENEIIINQWLADDLNTKTGDSVQLKYYLMGALRKLHEDSAKFVVKQIIPTENDLVDRKMMPNFPGMSNVGNCRDWETGATIDLKKIRTKDEKYWNDFKGTPKAIISIDKAHKLWANQFGGYTAFRLDYPVSNVYNLQTEIIKKLNPANFGLTFMPVLNQGLLAASNSTDFGQLFLSLSFFIIAAALLLSTLLFSLQLQNRLRETGVYSTLGFTKNQIFKIIFFEAILITIAGCLIGAFAGITYDKLIITGLNTLWQNAVQTTILKVFIFPSTIITGGISGIFLILIILFFILKSKLKNNTIDLITGNVLLINKTSKFKQNLINIICIGSFFMTIVSLIFLFTTNQFDNSEMFLTTGALFMIAGISFTFFILKKIQGRQNIVNTLMLCAIKNASLKKSRTLTTITLLALGIFSIVITAANRRTFFETENNRKSGTGGFTFWTETSIPILYDLNSIEGKKRFTLNDEPLLQNIRFVQLHRLDGTDASCLNLNQVMQPNILGVNPDYFDSLQVFNIINSLPEVDTKHPWLYLNKITNDSIIPAFADQSVITWQLQKNLGDTLTYQNEAGKKIKLRLLAGLDNSIFQGHILINEKILLRNYPLLAGTKIMLIDGKITDKKAVNDRLTNLFDDYGITIKTTSQKLADFNAVENTYLSVFVLLGTLGVVLGTIGLGIVILRNIQERKRELALYLSLGYTKKHIHKLLFIENGFIFIVGLSIGILSAFIGILPSLLSPAFTVPLKYLFVIITIIIANGFLWIYVSTQTALKGNLIEALRTE